MELSKVDKDVFKREKYGRKIKPFEYQCMIRNERWQTEFEIKYNYSRQDCYDNVEWEREPVRTMKIHDPR